MHNGELRLPESGWRILYAFAVVWMATYAALAVFRSAAQPEFVSNSVLRFNLPAGNLDAGEFAQMAHDSTQALVSGDTVTRLAAQAARQAGATLPELPSVEKLQQALQIVLKNEPIASLSISLSGEGKSYETIFVNALANELAIEMTRQLDKRFVDRWLQQLDASVDPTRTVHAAAQVHGELTECAEQIEQCRSLLMTAEQPGELTAQMQRLEADLAAKLAAGVAESSPEVESLRQQLAWLRPQVAAPSPDSVVAADQTTSPTLSDKARRNPYFTTADRKPVPEPQVASPQQRSDLLAGVDLTTALRQAALLVDEAAAMADRNGQAAARLSQYYAGNSPVVTALAEIRWADRPHFRSSPQSLPVSAVIIACLFAACAAYFYDPTQDRLRLKSGNDVARRLGMEVIGYLPAEPHHSARRWGSGIVAAVVRVSEAMVGFVMVVVVLACCAKPLLLQTFIQDPMYGLAHWLALVLS